MTQRKKTSQRLALAILFLSIGMGSSACNAPNSGPATAGDKSFGALATNMADYYYPTEEGHTYVYKNTITEFSNGGNQVMRTYTAGTDTLRTLGYQGFNSPNGDPVYAFSVTYRVSAERNNKDVFQLYYIPKGSSNNGGFITGNDPSGFSNVQSVNAVSAAIDTILYAVEGPARDVIDAPSTSKVWRTDKIFYTAHQDHVNIWWVENGAIRQTRLIWEQDFAKNDDWAYAAAVGDPYTTWVVKDVDAPLTTDAGNFTVAKIQAYTENLNTSTTEYKWWGRNTGLVRQYDEWRVTSDGQNFRKKTKVRELISMN
ncbi:MAG TPA: hypothetical protein VFH43_14260 [Candidatus Kapabacteria bacterium]|jgi:hypothetical protein|nr:hypothetical protein [Candidatus Kapabacteria bacterium]